MEKGKADEHMARKENEQTIPREALRAFIKENNLKTAENVHHALRDIFAGTPQEMLKPRWIRASATKSMMTPTRILRIGGTVTARKRSAVSMTMSHCISPVIVKASSNRPL